MSSSLCPEVLPDAMEISWGIGSCHPDCAADISSLLRPYLRKRGSGCMLLAGLEAGCASSASAAADAALRPACASTLAGLLLRCCSCTACHAKYSFSWAHSWYQGMRMEQVGCSVCCTGVLVLQTMKTILACNNAPLLSTAEHCCARGAEGMMALGSS